MKTIKILYNLYLLVAALTWFAAGVYYDEHYGDQRLDNISLHAANETQRYLIEILGIKFKIMQEKYIKCENDNPGKTCHMVFIPNDK